MKHAGYGRYDVEVNGRVVGRAVKRPEGWEATGAMPGVSVTVHAHDSLESACMAIGRALMGNRPRTGRDQLKAQVERLKGQLENAVNHLHGWRGRMHSESKKNGTLSEIIDSVNRCIYETPAQSLAEHDAALLREQSEIWAFAWKHSDELVSAEVVADWLSGQARRIEGKAKKAAK